MVPGGGLEPPRSCDLRILSPLRLPISPSGRVESNHLNLRMLFDSTFAQHFISEVAGFCQSGPCCDRYPRKDQLRAVPIVPAYSRRETIPECSKKVEFPYQPRSEEHTSELQS